MLSFGLAQDLSAVFRGREIQLAISKGNRQGNVQNEKAGILNKTLYYHLPIVNCLLPIDYCIWLAKCENSCFTSVRVLSNC